MESNEAFGMENLAAVTPRGIWNSRKPVFRWYEGFIAPWVG